MILNLFSKFLGGKKGGGAAGKAEAFLQAVSGDLHLDAGQKAALENALRNFMQGKKAAKQAGNKDGVQAEKEEFRTAVAAILNPEQLEKFTAKFQEYRQLLQK